MKKLSEIRAQRREGKRLKAIEEVPSVVAEFLKNSPGVVVTPGSNGWPSMTEEEQDHLNKKMELREYAYAAVHIELPNEEDFRVSIFSLNGPSVWTNYVKLIRHVAEDLPGKEAELFKEDLSKAAVAEQERLEKTYGIKLEPLQW